MKVTNDMVLESKKILAKRYFWEYCKLTAPDFYKEGRDYLKSLANKLQDFYFSQDKVMILNLPP